VSCLTRLLIAKFISFTECNSGTTQKLTFEVNTKIELSNMTTFDNTRTLINKDVPYKKAVLPDVVVAVILSLTL
jgi:hypothetical protein